jgi:1-pyrroline-4-hydroxy-2-carboxylate deaminase
MSIDWKGVFAAVCTQFHPDESLNVADTLKHIDTMLSAGVSGLVMLGTVGENYALSPDEKAELLQATVKHVKKKVPVLSGVAEYTTAMACKTAKMAASAGADGLMVLPAMVYNADVREAVYHFRTVAAATDLPVMIYNNPVSYRVDIKPETFGQLADIDTIVCIKESSDNPRRLTDIINLHGDRFTLFAGVDDLALESLMLGATGWISGLVNAFPHENQLLWELARKGDWVKAREVYRWYMPLLHLDTLPKLVQYIKLCAQECGYGSELCRAPRLNLEGAEREWVLGLVRKAIATRPKW